MGTPGSPSQEQLCPTSTPSKSTDEQPVSAISRSSSGCSSTRRRTRAGTVVITMTAPGGTVVTINGTHLTGATVTIGHQPFPFTQDPVSGPLTGTMPPHSARAVPIFVTTSGGLAAAYFRYPETPLTTGTGVNPDAPQLKADPHDRSPTKLLT